MYLQGSIQDSSGGGGGVGGGGGQGHTYYNFSRKPHEVKKNFVCWAMP